MRFDDGVGEDSPGRPATGRRGVRGASSRQVAPADAAVSHACLLGVLSSAVLIVDLSLPLGLAVGALHVVVVLASFWRPPPGGAPAVAAWTTLLILFGAAASAPSGDFPSYASAANRLVAVVAVWACALIGRGLWASPRGLRDVLAAAPVAHLVFGRSGRIRFANRQARRTLGAEPGDLVGRDVTLVVPGADGMDDEAEAAVRRQDASPFARRLDGTTFPVELVSHAVATPSGRATVLTLFDVGERRRLDRTRRLFATIVENSEDAILSQSLDGTVLSWSPGAAALFGYTAEQAVGRRIDQVLRCPRADRHDELLAAVAGGRVLRLHQVEFLARDGSSRVVSLVTSPLVDETGQVVGSAWIARDQTERLRMERRLADARRMEAVGELAGGVAHDFNNQLTVVLGHADPSLNGVRPDDPHWAAFQSIQRAAQRASVLTRQLLALGRRQVLAPRRQPLQTLIDTAASALESTLGDGIRFDRPSGIPRGSVEVDPLQLQEALAQVGRNAARALPSGGRVRLEARRSRLARHFAELEVEDVCRDYVELRVIDDGPGMPPDVRERALDPFYTRWDEPGHSGLGLSVAHGIVRQSGGDLALEPCPDGGTVVSILLPCTDADEDDDPSETNDVDERHQMPTKPQGPVVLLAEDETAIRVLFTRVLRRAGYVVHPASDGAHGAELLAELDTLDALVTDVRMPRRNGVELARDARRAHPDVPVLLVSGYAPDVVLGDRSPDSLGHLTTFLRKPISPRDLVRELERLLTASETTPRGGA